VSMKNTDKGNIAFVPLAMPLMCGPGAIATIIGMTSLIKHSEFEFFVFLAIACAILATMVMTIFAWRMQRIFWANWADGHRRRHSHRGVFRFRNCVLLSRARGHAMMLRGPILEPQAGVEERRVGRAQLGAKHPRALSSPCRGPRGVEASAETRS